MWKRVLLAIDESESARTAVDFVTGLAKGTATGVWVFHIREIARHTKVLPMETPVESQFLVDEAVFSLRLAGIVADGSACSYPATLVARRIADEAANRSCDAIVIGSRRLRGFDRISGRGVRERLLRLSDLPLIVAPAPILSGIHGPARSSSDRSGGQQAPTPGSRKHPR